MSRVARPNVRWAIDATHVFCGQDGWCHLTAIIDCCDRTIVSWRLSRSGVARIAAAALEDALRDRSTSRQWSRAFSASKSSAICRSRSRSVSVASSTIRVLDEISLC